MRLSCCGVRGAGINGMMNDEGLMSNEGILSFFKTYYQDRAKRFP